MIEILQARSPSQAGCVHTFSAVTMCPATQHAGAGGKKAPRLSLRSRDMGGTTCHPWQGCRARLCPRPVATAWDRQHLLLGPRPCSIHVGCCQAGVGLWDRDRSLRLSPSSAQCPCVTCPQRGGTVPPGGVTTQDRRQRQRGQGGQPLDTDPAARALPWPRGRRQGKREKLTGEQLSSPLIPPQQPQAPSLWKRIYQN